MVVSGSKSVDEFGDSISNAMQRINVSQNRGAKKYSLSVQIKRFVWSLAYVVFRMSPRPFYGIRNLLLRSMGATIGENVRIANSAKISFPWNLRIGDDSAIGDEAIVYPLGEIVIEDRVTISQYAHLCAGSHDYESSAMTLLKPNILIESDSWICASAFVGPGITIGEGAVIGAAAVATKDVDQWTVVAGNPAKRIKKRVLRPSGSVDD